MPEIRFKDDIDVNLVQSVGGDHMVVAAAKVSTTGTDAIQFARDENVSENEGLIRYLIKHRHGTPFEHASMTFFVHAPILVWREWHRHRVGFCLTGDTEIWRDTVQRNGSRKPLKQLSDLWNHGITDSMGRYRTPQSLGTRQQTLRVMNEESTFMENATPEDIFESGTKEIFHLETQHSKWNSLKCSADHQVLTDQGWARVGDLSGDELIYVNSKRNFHQGKTISRKLREAISEWARAQKMEIVKIVDRCYICSCSFSYEELEVDHIIPVMKDLPRALDRTNLGPVCEKCHQRKSSSESSGNFLDKRQNFAAGKLTQLLKKPMRISEEMTYDIAMGGKWHNFIANGIVVHNSYNEESGRYKQLEPIFYLPKRDRPMMKVEGWKPGRPKFLLCQSEEIFDRLIENLKRSYEVTYEAYEDNLKMGIDPGLARDGLSVGIYSGCWVTCNPRSMMAFLSLRTHEPDADAVSYPLYEIELAARACEEIFKKGWPITYKAFCDNGRVAP